MQVTAKFYSPYVARANTGYCAFYVRTIDTTAPTITCPSSTAINTDPGVTTTSYSFALPTAYDNVFAYPPTCDHARPFTYTFAAPTFVTCNTSDTSNNGASCSFTISVFDNEPPSIVCPTDVTNATAPGSATRTIAFPAPNASDNVQVASVGCTLTDPFTFSVGATAVTCV